MIEMLVCRTTFCPTGVMHCDEISVAIVHFAPHELCMYLVIKTEGDPQPSGNCVG